MRVGAVILAGIFVVFSAVAKPGSALPPELAQVEKVLARYRSAPGVSMKVKKRTLNSLMGSEKLSEGRLFYSKSKMRLEIEKPETALLVMDGTTIWFATKLSEDMGGKTMVSKTSNRAVRKANAVMAALFDNRRLFKEFKLDHHKSEKDQASVTLVPLKAESTEIQKLELEIKPKDGSLVRVVYWDDRENEVRFDLGEPDFKASLAKDLFIYKPPKGAEVTEY